MNKSKKSKSDILRSAVSVYLKQKSYVGNDKERFRKSDFLLVQNKKQFVFQKMLQADVHYGNCFQYSNVLCITNNPHIVDLQFGRFSQFIESQAEQLRLELRRFYGPILCHFYIELIKAREHKAALDLLKKYSHLIAPAEFLEEPILNKLNGFSVFNDTQNNTLIRFTQEPVSAEDTELAYFMKLIELLSGCVKLEAIESNPDIVHFRSSKYEIHTTADVIQVLRGYFEKRGHVLILNLLFTWIHVHIIDNELRQWSEDSLFLINLDGDNNEHGESKTQYSCDRTTDRGSVKRFVDEVPESTNIQIDKKEDNDDPTINGVKKTIKFGVSSYLEKLQDFKNQLSKAQLEYPRFIRIGDQSQSLSTAQLDNSGCHLACGFNNSLVQIWQINQITWYNKQLYKTYEKSCCDWAINNTEPDNKHEMEELFNEYIFSANYDEGSQKYKTQKCADNSYNAFGGICLRGHGSGVTAVRFSSHYPLIYSTSKDSTIRTWFAGNYTCANIYRGHRYPIWCIDESPVGMYTATGSKDLTARLWSLEREFPLITYAGHTQDVECLSFHPNGNYIATGSADMSVRFWCVTSGKLMRVFSDCKQPVTTIAFSPDGKLLAAGGEETKIRIFDLAAGSQLTELKEHSSSVTDLAWNKNGSQLASACRDGSLRLWDIKKLLCVSEYNAVGTSAASSSAPPSSSNATNRIITLTSQCKRLVNVNYSKNDEITCIGN